MFWCAGMMASGSTWAYNIMRAITAELWPVPPVHGRFVNAQTPADLDGIDDPGFTQVVKSHELPEDMAAVLLGRARRIVSTIRDPRDAVTSLMLYQRFPFPMALKSVADSARFVRSLTADPRVLLLRYEYGFTEDAATIDRIAEWLGGRLADEARAQLFAQSRRAAIEAQIRAFDSNPHAHRDERSGDVFDLQSQWHLHHAGRSGEIGRWQHMLSPGQTGTVERELADWMRHFGYYAAQAVTQGYTLRVGRFGIE